MEGLSYNKKPKPELLDNCEEIKQNEEVKIQQLQEQEKSQEKTPHIKEGVDFVFEQNPELADIGTPEQYSAYLNTIFPDSQVKDIVYHGTKSQKFNYFNTEYSGTGSGNKINTDGSVYFIKYHQATKTFGHNIISALINTKNPNIIPLKEFNKNWVNKLIFNEQKNNSDCVIGEQEKTPQEYYNEALEEYNLDPGHMFARKPKDSEEFMEEQLVTTYVVFNPNQIHILGSQPDIENFKSYVASLENNL